MVVSGSRFPQRRSSAAASSDPGARGLGARPRPMVFSAMAFSSAARFQSVCALGLPLLCRWVVVAGAGDPRRQGFLELLVCKGPGDLVVIFHLLGPFVLFWLGQLSSISLYSVSVVVLRTTVGWRKAPALAQRVCTRGVS